MHYFNLHFIAKPTTSTPKKFSKSKTSILMDLPHKMFAFFLELQASHLIPECLENAKIIIM